MKPKEKELLSLLYQNQNRFLTGRELAQALHISERTVRSYIRRMEPVITENGGEILAKQGNGYRLLLRRPVQFAVLAGTPGTETTRKTAQTPDSAQERRRYLMQRLLLNGETLQAEETAERLYVSTSTLKKELYQLRGMLDEYGLVFDSGPAGISIHGDETSKRALIMDYFFRSSTFNSIQEYMDHSGYFDDIPTEQLLRMVLDESRQFGIRLSDIMVQNVLLHLALSVKRMQAGLRPEHAVLPPAFEQSSEYQASSAIFRRLSGMTGGEYPAEEVSYLALHLSGKGSWATRQPAQGEHLEQEVKTVLSQLAEDDVMQLDEDPQLVSSLLEHLRPMVVRLMRGLPQKNPLTQDILRDQPDLMKVIRKYFGAMPCLRRYDIDDDEWAYLALHIMAALERQKEKRKLQVLVVCATGYGSSQLLKSRLMKHFSDSLHIVTETGYYEMSDDILQGIDLIISSVNIGPVIFGVPFIHVSVFLGEEDVQNIQRFIDQEKAGPEKKEPAAARPASKSQKEIFDCYFSEEDFRVYKGHPERDQVLSDLVETLACYEKDSFADHMREQIRLRSQMGSLVFSDTIAVPHPAVPLSKVARLALALIPEGMYWNESHPAIRFVFLMSPSYVENRNLPKVTGAIVSLMEEPVLQEQILQEQSFDVFGRILGSLIETA
ncbi:BglG family transcription antiterminator [Faecalibaculum rodentium]|uniref:Protein-N-phosphohistidine-sugar phosphotransferase n=6 Tax=Faecalibaculum rodentium TaxID=1702221 RepID=A0A140DW42_9FIRM|nr:BglG family transcription antiterminator [Faecalibaculum rodentium]AMK54869.1 protein-N-phosphohistidine-sugar phosphotransferase [Faecalibaculum rodentium]